MDIIHVGERKWNKLDKAQTYPDLTIVLHYQAISKWYRLFLLGFEPKTEAEVLVINSVRAKLKQHIEKQTNKDPDYWEPLTITWNQVEFFVIHKMSYNINNTYKK